MASAEMGISAPGGSGHAAGTGTNEVEADVQIANGEMIRRLLEVNGDLNRSTPLIVTPEAILEPLKGEDA